MTREARDAYPTAVTRRRLPLIAHTGRVLARTTPETGRSTGAALLRTWRDSEVYKAGREVLMDEVRDSLVWVLRSSRSYRCGRPSLEEWWQQCISWSVM